MSDLTDLQHDYVRDVFGVDPRAYPAKPAAGSSDPGAAAGGSADSAPPAASAGSTEGGGKGLKFSQGVPGLPSAKVKACGDRIEIEIKPVIEISGTATLAATDDTKVDGGALAKALLEFATGWVSSTATPALTKGNLWSNLKVERSGAGFAAKSETDTPVGKLSLELTLAKFSFSADHDNVKLALQVLVAKATMMTTRVKAPDTTIAGIALTELELASGGEITIAPAWKEILAKWMVEKIGQSALEDAGQAVVATVSVDVVITGAIIIGGVATIAASIYSIVQAWGIGDLAQSYKPSLDNTRAGFKAAMSGGAAPTDAYGKAGYDAGLRNYQQLFDKTRKDFPQAADDAIKAAVAGKADEALNQVAGALDDAVRRGLWDGYLAQHTTMLTSGDAKWAFVACFGDLPKESDAQWKKYVAQHPTASKF